MIFIEILLFKRRISLKILKFLVIHSRCLLETTFLCCLLCVRACYSDKGMLVSFSAEEFYGPVIKFTSNSLISEVTICGCNEKFSPRFNFIFVGYVCPGFQLVDEFKKNLGLSGVQWNVIESNVRSVIKCYPKPGDLFKYNNLHVKTKITFNYLF